MIMIIIYNDNILIYNSSILYGLHGRRRLTNLTPCSSRKYAAVNVLGFEIERKHSSLPHPLEPDSINLNIYHPSTSADTCSISPKCHGFSQALSPLQKWQWLLSPQWNGIAQDTFSIQLMCASTSVVRSLGNTIKVGLWKQNHHPQYF